MNYCKNCGGGLPDGARFCASCGMPAGNDETYIHIPPAAGMQPVNGTQPYVNGAQPEANGMQPYVNGTQPEASGMQPYANGAQPEASGMQPYANGTQPEANGMQPYANGTPPYANGMQPYADGQRYGSGEATYLSGQTMRNAQPYQNIPMQGDGYPVEDPYSPYGRVVQPQSNRKPLAIIGMITGLIVAAAFIILIVLVMRDNSHRTYQQAVGVFMNGLKRQNIGRMADAFPERIREEVRRDMTRYYDSERELWKDYNESLEWYCGEHAKVTYTIVQAEPLLDYQISDCEKDCLEDFHYEVSISRGYEVEIELTFQGSEGEYSTDLELEVVKIDGKWYVIGY